MSRVRLHLRGRGGYGNGVTPGGAAPTYAATMGVNVDSNGYTLLNPGPSGKVFYVRPSTGNDSHTGLNPSLPLATFQHGLSLLTAGTGDMLLVAEGEIVTEQISGYLSPYSGLSATYPTVFSTYDPADPTNWAKVGMGHQRPAGRPKWTAVQPQLSNGTFGRLAIKGFEWNPGSAGGVGWGLQGGGGGITDILVENNIFAYCVLNFDNGQAPPELGGYTGNNFVFRNNSVYGAWDPNLAGDGRNGGGMLIEGGFHNVVIEDNTFWHTGWRMGGTRIEIGNQGTQCHALYLQTDTDCLVQRNLMVDCVSDGGILRGNGIWRENVTIKCPSGTGLGPEATHWNDIPGGCDLQAMYNLTMEGLDNGAGVPGYGYTTGKGKAGARVHHNAIIINENVVPIDSQIPSAFSNVALGTGSGSYMEFDNNVVYQWTPSGDTYFVQPDPTYGPWAVPFTTYNYNFWDNPAAGTNRNISSATFPTTYTLTSVLTALSFPDYATFTSVISTQPELQIQRKLRWLVMTGYGVPVDETQHDIVAPVLSSPSASASGGTVTIHATEDEANGQMFAVLSPTVTALDVARVMVAVDASDAPLYFAPTITVSSTGVQTLTATNIPSGTYYVQIVHEDAQGNRQTTPAITSAVTVTAPGVLWKSTSPTSADWAITGAGLIATRSAISAFWALLYGDTSRYSGSIIYTINAIGTGGLGSYFGFDVANGIEDQYPGQSSNNSAAGICYTQGGSIILSGAGTIVSGLATLTTGDKLKITKAFGTFTFYKWIGGVWTQQGSAIDTLGGPYSFGDKLKRGAFPCCSNGNGTGTQITMDASGW